MAFLQHVAVICSTPPVFVDILRCVCRSYPVTALSIVEFCITSDKLCSLFLFSVHREVPSMPRCLHQKGPSSYSTFLCPRRRKTSAQSYSDDVCCCATKGTDPASDHQLRYSHWVSNFKPSFTTFVIDWIDVNMNLVWAEYLDNWIRACGVSRQMKGSTHVESGFCQMNSRKM